MHGSSSKGPGKKARVEIIPLIDVVFFLLATFVLFTLSLNKILSLPVDLPVATPPQPTNDIKPEIVAIQVSDAGVYWNKELIKMDDLPDRLTSYVQQEKDPRVLISGDDLASFGAGVTVLDEVRKAHIEKVSVETRIHASGK